MKVSEKLIGIKNKIKTSKFFLWVKRCNVKRMENSKRFKLTNIFLMVFFPFFITTMAEIIQMKTVDKFVIFLFKSPMIVLFNVLLCSLFYIILLFVSKRAWVPTLVIGLVYTVLSIVELFKFNTSGNHLILTDMKLAVNIEKLTAFAYIKITVPLVICVALIFSYIALVFILNPLVNIKIAPRVVGSVASLALVIVGIVPQTIANSVYAFFGIDTSASDNVFRLNNKFDNNNFLAFLTQTTTEYFNQGRVKKPDNYNPDIFDDLLPDDDDKNEEFDSPNVIFIMSEAFADFRVFGDKVEVPEGTYDALDRITSGENVHSGFAVVPTLGSYTCKTEFELNFGLPSKSLNDPNMPHRLLLDRDQFAVPRYYKALGYNTNYIHTFLRSFYNRDEIFPNYGYDKLYFDDNLTVDTEFYRSYISDTTVFNQIEKILKDTKGPAFIHTTTMQNHQPYDSETQTQLEYYLEGIENMLGNLENFLNHLNEIGEETIVVFIGDHFPCFKGVDSIYDELVVDPLDCKEMYEQHYFIWSNFEVDYSNVPTEPFSTFYFPYIMLDLIDAPKTAFVDTMLEKLEEIPVYSTVYNGSEYRDEDLDLFTYDIVLGEQYIGESMLPNKKN